MFDRRQTREWIHGLTALILGLFLLGAGANLGISKGMVDLLSGLLFIPEYPAVYLRGVFRGWWDWAQDKNILMAELARLKEENAKLRILGAALESERIRADLNDRTSEARITLRAPMSWWNEIRIDKGEHENIIVGSPVFCDGYLVGRVTSVSLLSSWVELLTSPSLMIPVVIEETRELGVVVGDGNGNVLLKYIPAGRGHMIGMRVNTALIGEQLPSGLPVGKIIEELGTTADGYASYRIEPGADLSKFYSVSLLRPVAAQP